MMLIKNSFRSLKQKPIQFLCLVMVFMLSSFISVTLEGAISSVRHSLDQFTTGTNQEDFFIVLAQPTESDIRQMLERRGVEESLLQGRSKAQMMQRAGYTLVDFYEDLIAQISEEFDATLEGRFFRDVFQIRGEQDEMTHTYRLIRKTEDVNLTYVVAGSLPTDAQEIGIFREYALQNDLNLGDTLTLHQKEFIISAFIAVPDYIYPIFSFDSPLFNPQTQTVAMVTDETYSQFVEREWVLYSGFFNGETNMEQAITNIGNFPGVSYAMNNQMNVRISTIDFHLSSNRVLATTFSGILLLMCIVVVVLVMKKRINGERVQIGILKSMGYGRLSIISSYLVYPLLAALSGSLIGFYLGIGFAIPLANTYTVNFVIPNVGFYYTHQLLLIGVFYPALVVLSSSFIMLLSSIKGQPISLMQESSHLQVSPFTRFFGRLLSSFSFKTRFKYALALRNIWKLLSLFTVVFIASVFVVFASIAFQTVERVTEKAFGRASFSYEVKLSQNESLESVDLLDDETPFLRYRAYPDLDVLSTPFYIYGIDPTNEINPLYNALDENITSLSQDGLLINEFIARAYGLGVGDTLTMKIRNEKFTYSIVGIVNNFNGPMLYISSEQLAEDLNLRVGTFNGKWTNERPILDQRISYVFSMEELERNIEMGMTMIRISLNVMVVIAVILGSFMMIVITNFIIDENQKQISILKVMGYGEDEVSKMVLTIYLPFVIGAYLIAVGFTRLGIDFVMTQIANQLPMAIPTDFSLSQLLGGAAIVMLTYAIAMKISKIQLNKVSLQEILKY